MPLNSIIMLIVGVVIGSLVGYILFQSKTRGQSYQGQLDTEKTLQELKSTLFIDSIRKLGNLDLKKMLSFFPTVNLRSFLKALSDSQKKNQKKSTTLSVVSLDKSKYVISDLVPKIYFYVLSCLCTS